MADNDKKKQKKPRVKLEFWDADEVKDIAGKLIPKYHSHLVNARIKYVFRSVASKRGERVILGHCTKIGGRQEFLTGVDFVVEVAYDQYQALTPAQRTALIDHELCHAWAEEDDKTGDMRYSIRGHDVEEFSEVIRRHGLWLHDVETFAQVVRDVKTEAKTKVIHREQDEAADAAQKAVKDKVDAAGVSVA